jgi:proteic killer suppression protein
MPGVTNSLQVVTPGVTIRRVIRSFADRDTEQVWKRLPVRRWPPELHRAAYRKLLMIDAAENLQDLRVPPGNRLEKLGGDRAGQYSVRINEQWRVCFHWKEGHADEVEITDYH